MIAAQIDFCTCHDTHHRRHAAARRRDNDAHVGCILELFIVFVHKLIDALCAGVRRICCDRRRGTADRQITAVKIRVVNNHLLDKLYIFIDNLKPRSCPLFDRNTHVIQTCS